MSVRTPNNVKIGVFDSGIGGESVAVAIRQGLPDAEVLFLYDAENFPYATKTPEEIYRCTLPIFHKLVDARCDVIVVACNTVSTTLITRLRADFAVPLVAIEPMIKPAAELTKSGVIAVCATPTTLASSRYRWLKKTYAPTRTIIEPDCADWSYLIEHNQMNNQKIRDAIEPAIEKGADVVVLGCTHYHWIEEQIRSIVKDNAIVLQPETAIVAQIKRVLARQS